MVPCVYFTRPGSGYPSFFCAATDIYQARAIAHNLRYAFAVPTWIADWADVAHVPTPLDRDLAAARAKALESRP